MKLVTLTATVAMAGLLALITGCETSHVHKESFDFSQYHTFAIGPLPTGGTHWDPTLGARLGPTFRQTLRETLIGKGFKEVPQGEADFQVKLLFDYSPVPEDEFGRQELHMFEIHISDSKSNQVVWSNWRKRTKSRDMSPETARKIVAEMLQPFPPGAH